MEKQSGAGRFFRTVDLLWKLFAVGVYGVFLIMKIARGTGIFAINVSLLAVNGIYALALCVRALAGGARCGKNASTRATGRENFFSRSRPFLLRRTVS